MNPYVERLQKVIAFVAAFLFIICLLLSSFEWAVYKDEDYKFYEKEYEKYEVTKELDMEMEDVMHVTEEMMAYLIGEREELSVWTTVEGREQDFFNEQDRFHMGEVRTLFIGGLKLRNGLFFVVAWSCTYTIFSFTNDPRVFLDSLNLAMAITGALLELNRKREQYYVFTLASIFTIALWFQTMLQGDGNFALIFSYSVFFLNDMYAFFSKNSWFRGEVSKKA